MRRLATFLFCVLMLHLHMNARDGMWMPNLLKQLNGADLKALGLELPVEDLFRPDSLSLKDAIVQFGGGCTGEIVSSKGLLFTNHHCGFSQIQSLSTLEHNYLDSGFWAKSLAEEIPCPGLTVTFIREIRDVTAEILSGIPPDAGLEAREKRIRIASDSLEKSAITGTGYKALIKPFYGGNEYYLFITEAYRDIRFVGAPPSSIGNFGGETDNWMWSRHTGDFSVFRIYAGKDNRPADYAADNIPYSPRKWLTIQTGGIKEGDFTMVYGFPGRTAQFLTSASLRQIKERLNPVRIELRDMRLNIWREKMSVNDTVRLKYSSKFRTLANAYKKWKGELMGMNASEVVQKKLEFEKTFSERIARNPDWNLRYGSVLENLRNTVDSSEMVVYVNELFNEGLMGIELFGIAAKLKPLADLCKASPKDEGKLSAAATKTLNELNSTYKNYDALLDRQVASAILAHCTEKIPTSYAPAFLEDYRKSAHKFIERLYTRSAFASKARAEAFLKNFNSASLKKLEEDPAYKAYMELAKVRSSRIDTALAGYNQRIAALQRLYIRAIRELQPETPIAPDANSTLRLSYGKVQGIQPKDGVLYNWYTTVDGILEKSRSAESDYSITADYRSLLERASGSTYANSGKIPVAFLASNHTTGGNSGSPVLNARGELIGINFDRIWEGVVSDYYYIETLSRNIAVDIRYVLFVIDSVGNARRLIEEMTIRN